MVIAFSIEYSFFVARSLLFDESEDSKIGHQEGYSQGFSPYNQKKGIFLLQETNLASDPKVWIYISLTCEAQEIYYLEAELLFFFPSSCWSHEVEYKSSLLEGERYFHLGLYAFSIICTHIYVYIWISRFLVLFIKYRKELHISLAIFLSHYTFTNLSYFLYTNCLLLFNCQKQNHRN